MSRTTALALRDASRAAMAQQRERLEELTNHIRRNMAGITESFFEIGEALAEIANNRLYIAGGFDTFEELLEKHQLFTRQYAQKLIAVATLMPRDVAVQLGPEKSYLLVRYAHAREDSVRDVVRERALTSMTTRELRDAVREGRASKPATKRKPSATQRKAAEAQASLRQAGLRSASVRLSRRKSADVFVVELSPANMARLVESLSR